MSFNEWRTVKLKEIGDIITGKTPSTKNESYYNGEYLFITPRDMVGDKNIINTERKLSEDGLKSVSKQVLQGTSICVSCIGSDMGKVIITNKVGVTNQQINSITNIKDSYDINFIYYTLKPMKEYLHNIAGGSTMPIVNKSTFEEIEIKIPQLEEQKAIAKILSDLDDKIEVNNKINKNLEEMAQAIFKHWFVDFEFPNEEGKPYKSSGGEMVESELGIIPKGWEVDDLYSISDVIYGAPFASKLFNEEGIGLPLIRIRDLKSGTPTFYTDEERKNSTIVYPGDILVGMDAEFTPTIWKGKKAYLNQRVCMLKPNKEYIHKYYLYEMIKPYMRFFEYSKVATTVIHLSKGDMDSIKIVKATEGVYKQYFEVVDSIHSKIINISKETDSLSNLRDILLPKLMSGEIRVPID